ncbi:hypothetical protein I3215_20720 [Streptomyces sp. RB110-1]|uniref:hypothetical protein n=1 Tax=unclassified Streptomyces TaxID=2593676 RepID=UPI0018FF8418|nr:MULTISPECIES: hypothetical protein [unclassified Streptomyces]MBK0375291.1 hypothetical protein [Streptomyces sp. RB110-1]MBK0388335.1 hypothetical protein [Streptomyces sp. RB110-2]
MQETSMVAELGDDWCDVTADRAEDCDLDHLALAAELSTEVHPAHPFFGTALEVIAHRLTNDDVLCRHHATPSRYSILHLTWSHREEIGGCPTIDADGEWRHIIAYENAVDAALSGEALSGEGRKPEQGPTGQPRAEAPRRLS